MKTILKKMTALFATALILLTALPISASAQSRILLSVRGNPASGLGSSSGTA